MERNVKLTLKDGKEIAVTDEEAQEIYWLLKGLYEIQIPMPQIPNEFPWPPVSPSIPITPIVTTPWIWVKKGNI